MDSKIKQKKKVLVPATFLEMTSQSAALVWPRREVSWTYFVATLIPWQRQLLKLHCETWAFPQQSEG